MVVVLAQAVLFYFYPALTNFSERKIFGAGAALPVFIPLYFTIGYGIVSRHTAMSFLLGLVSWWAAPVILLLQGQPLSSNPPAAIADGFVYGAIGFLAAKITNFLAGRKLARPK